MAIRTLNSSGMEMFAEIMAFPAERFPFPVASPSWSVAGTQLCVNGDIAAAVNLSPYKQDIRGAMRLMAISAGQDVVAQLGILIRDKDVATFRVIISGRPFAMFFDIPVNRPKGSSQRSAIDRV